MVAASEHGRQPAKPGGAMKGRILAGAAVVVVAVAGCLVVGLGPGIWARSWERKWCEFRGEWEARGEDFGVAAHLPPEVPDADNFARHPWVAAAFAGEPAATATLGELDPRSVELLAGWGEREDDGDGVRFLREHPQALQRARARYERLAPELESVEAAAGRPGCRLDLDLDQGFGMPLPTSALQSIGRALACRADVAIAAADGTRAARDAVTLLRIGGHLRRQNVMIMTLIGASLQSMAMATVRCGLDEDVFDPEDRRMLAAAAAKSGRPIAREAAAYLRFERGMMLAELDRMEAGLAAGGDPGVKLPGGWQPGAARARVLFARGRLALCENLQWQLLAADGAVLDEIRMDHLDLYEQAVSERFDDPDPYETIAAIMLPLTRSTVRRLEEVDGERSAVLERLR